ncbi:unknown protein [Grouper iridovirus]|uniref:Uncharacterized protein n=1 Tax=Grouper iridovirus TaxID=127569 RepID=Q5GAL3_9VIRU|nr:unknown protein [Grouper iridovirus]
MSAKLSERDDTRLLLGAHGKQQDVYEEQNHNREENHRATAVEAVLKPRAGVGVVWGPEERYDMTLQQWLNNMETTEQQIEYCYIQLLLAIAVLQGECSMVHENMSLNRVKVILPDAKAEKSYRTYKMGNREFHVPCNAPLCMLDDFSNTCIYNPHLDRHHGKHGKRLGITLKDDPAMGPTWGVAAGSETKAFVTVTETGDPRIPRTYPAWEFGKEVRDLTALLAPFSPKIARIQDDMTRLLGNDELAWMCRPDVTCARYFPTLSSPPPGKELLEVVSWTPRTAQN